MFTQEGEGGCCGLSAVDDARRVAQLLQAGQTADFEAILATIKARDDRDENRATAPSKPAEDALVLDSSNLDADAVYELVKKHCQDQGICFNR